MADKKEWARNLGEDFERLMAEVASMEIAVASFMLNLYRRDAYVSSLQMQWDELCRMNADVEPRVQHWIAVHKPEAPESLEISSLQTPFAASQSRAEALMKIRLAQFPRVSQKEEQE